METLNIGKSPKIFQCPQYSISSYQGNKTDRLFRYISLQLVRMFEVKDSIFGWNDGKTRKVLWFIGSSDPRLERRLGHKILPPQLLSRCCLHCRVCTRSLQVGTRNGVFQIEPPSAKHRGYQVLVGRSSPITGRDANGLGPGVVWSRCWVTGLQWASKLSIMVPIIASI